MEKKTVMDDKDSATNLMLVNGDEDLADAGEDARVLDGSDADGEYLAAWFANGRHQLDLEDIADHLTLLAAEGEYVTHRPESVRGRQRGVPMTPTVKRDLRRRRQVRAWRAGAGVRVGRPQQSRARSPRRARVARPVAKAATSDSDGPAPDATAQGGHHVSADVCVRSGAGREHAVVSVASLGAAPSIWIVRFEALARGAIRARNQRPPQ